MVISKKLSSSKKHRINNCGWIKEAERSIKYRSEYWAIDINIEQSKHSKYENVKVWMNGMTIWLTKRFR